jgi:hypothetical protein
LEDYAGWLPEKVVLRRRAGAEDGDGQAALLKVSWFEVGGVSLAKLFLHHTFEALGKAGRTRGRCAPAGLRSSAAGCITPAVHTGMAMELARR